MAIISGGALESRPEKTTFCRGPNFLSHQVGGRSFLNISVSKCNYSDNNNGSVQSDNDDAGENQRRRRREDAILPRHIDQSRAMTWWLPIYGWSRADQERWVDGEIDESKTKGAAMHSSSDDDEKAREEVPPERSKFVRGHLTPEKAKLLRKNLRDTSTFRDTMYHSAIASRLASPDNEGHP